MNFGLLLCENMSISGLNWIAVEKYLFVFGFSVLDVSIVKKKNRILQ